MSRSSPYSLLRSFWGSGLGKYKEIVAAIGVFIILDAGVLLLNFYATYQISDDAHAIRLATRQAMLTQRIFHSVELVRDDLVLGRDFEFNQSKLASSYKEFDEVFDAFIYGGRLIGQGQGQDELLLGDDYQKLSDEHLKPAETIWKVYRQLISSLVYADYYDSHLDKDELLLKANQAIVQSSLNGDGLLLLVSDFAKSVEDKANQKAINLRMVQAVAITLAIINFFIILFHFLKRLRRSDAVVKQSQDELSEIMRTVNDGLFLLDKHYTIGSQYSQSMQPLFRRSKFEGVNFFTLLEPLVDDKTLTVVRDYVDSLFNKRVKSSLMDELNPLQQVELLLHNKHGENTHYFSFGFTRVYQKGDIVHLLVAVKDVSESVDLKKKLALVSDNKNQESESLFALMNIDEQLLEEFMVLLNKGLSSINLELKKSAYNYLELSKKLDKIKRIAHSLKGEASMLGLDVIVNHIHELEDKLALLDAKEGLEGDDFLPIAMVLNQLIKSSDSVATFSTRLTEMMAVKTTALMNKIQVDKIQLDKTPIQPTSVMPAYHKALINLAEKISRETHKKVKVNLDHFNHDVIPLFAKESLKVILVQLMRNAIVHGLEKPKKRALLGKSEEGLIVVTAEVIDDHAVVSVKDDGRGINFNAIKQYVLQQEHYSAEQVEKMPANELVKFIFKPGFSTAKHVDNHAGRGVGLDVVKESIDNMGAFLSVRCKTQRSSEFRIRIPLCQPLAKSA